MQFFLLLHLEIILIKRDSFFSFLQCTFYLYIQWRIQLATHWSSYFAHLVLVQILYSIPTESWAHWISRVSVKHALNVQERTKNVSIFSAEKMFAFRSYKFKVNVLVQLNQCDHISARCVALGFCMKCIYRRIHFAKCVPYSVANWMPHCMSSWSVHCSFWTYSILCN